MLRDAVGPRAVRVLFPAGKADVEAINDPRHRVGELVQEGGARDGQRHLKRVFVDQLQAGDRIGAPGVEGCQPGDVAHVGQHRR